MSVLLETSKGDIVIDLFIDDCPKAATNFLKLCKIKYYNNCLFYNVQSNFIVQTGDPTNTGKGGDSIWGVLYGEQARFFDDELRPHLKHKRRGMVAMASVGENRNASQFYFTIGEDLKSLDEKHTIFGEIAEGMEVLDAINDVPVDEGGRPLQNIRIRHTIILEDPFPDPSNLAEHIPDASPPPVFANDGRLEDDWVPEEDQRDIEEIERANREKEAKNRAVVLEMIGDLPEADAAPPSNMLFICKLNPVTTEEDLEIIFSRFGNVTSCDIIRDWKTGDSLCYGFIGFDSEGPCEEAYFKMNNVLIDDRRIKVDFSQSVSHLWKQFKRFGGKGDAGMGKEADEHRNQGKHGRDRLELKPQFQRGPPPGQRGYNLLLDDDGGAGNNNNGGVARRPSSREPTAAAAAEYTRKRDDRNGDRSGVTHRRRSRSRDRERRRSRSRDRVKDKERRRSRSRSRERRKERRRSHSRDDRKRRERSRSRSRERRRDR